MNKLLTATKRIIKYGFLNFIRNGFVSLATILVMTIALFMISTSMFADAALKSVLDTLKAQVDINVYFMPDAPVEKIKDLENKLAVRPEIASVKYTSKEEVLKTFKERHKDDELTIQSLEELGDNPFGATLSLRARDPSQYESIAGYINQKIDILNKEGKIIDKVSFYDSKRAIDTLNSIIHTSKQIMLAVIAFLIFVAVLIVFNTIRLAVYINKEEISVMKLVGASDAYVQGPFVVEGALYGILAASLTLLALYPLTVWLSDAAASFLVTFNPELYFKENIVKLASVVYGVGILLGVASSYLSVRRYLDV